MFGRFLWLLLIAIPCIAPATASEQLDKDALEVLGPLPAQWKRPVDNPATLLRNQLGRNLFDDTRM